MAEAGTRLDDAAVEQRLERLDELLDRVEQVPGPTASAALDAVRLLTEVYGEGLARVLEVADDRVLERLRADTLLRHLLVLHDLDPDPVERRVQRAVEALRPELDSQGARLELVAVEDGVARIRLSGGGCHSCSSDSVVLEDAVRGAILALAPELAAVESLPSESGGGQPLIPVEALLRRPVAAGEAP